MSSQTETLDIGLGSGADRSRVPASVGIVTLYAPEGGAVPRFVPLASAFPLVFGREPPAGLVAPEVQGSARAALALPFGSVSRMHAKIFVRGAEIILEDLDSRNGTFLNGTKIAGKAFVSPGDEIRVGEVFFKVVEIPPGEGAQALYEAGSVGVPAAPFGDLRGGASMERVRREVLRIAKADLSILVLGETGTGKELVARALHEASGRTGRMSTVNCAAIPSTLFESELFGYKRGAFTGADRDRIGIVKSADGGTLFLDEIGDMPLEAQAKLLRLIETRQVTPLGSHVAEPVDVRIVSATHRPLSRLVKSEAFRADLFARISGHTIELPPLRHRKEDVEELVRLFLERAGGSHLRITPPFLLGLLDYDWPLNVRELETAVKRAVALADKDLDASHLPRAITHPDTDEPEDGQTKARAVAPAEAVLRGLLERHSGNVAAVARELEKDRVQIHRWMRRYGISPGDFRGS